MFAAITKKARPRPAERWQSGNEDIHKSAQAGIRFSLPPQVSHCQGAFFYIIH
jgi:hypothetical protein